MILIEIYDQNLAGFQDVQDDNSAITLSDLRKTKLTLRQINKLRQMNDTRIYEKSKNLIQIRKQYAPATSL